ncbi:MAG: hypothetical protein NDI61_10310, partial [Bdellovibrionaceae bacterium]|nr:hypothetical protein [Pseudobdellovibrionaceae bacterium]
PPTIYLTSYLSDGVPASIGIVDEIQAQEKQAAFLQYVILKLDREANVGERFSAVMPRGNVSNKQSRSYGPIVEIGGTVEIVEAVDPARRAYRAVVIKSVMPIEPKAIITEMPLPKVSFSRNATRADVEARVIGGEYDKSRKVMGSGSVVYLDQGTTGGLQEGQILAVRASRGSRRKNTDYPNDSQPIAVIKVARALERVSTAVILDTTAEVTPGDVTGGPLPQPSRAINALGSTRAMNVDNAARPSEDSDYQEETDDLDEDLEDDSNLEAEEAAD